MISDLAKKCGKSEKQQPSQSAFKTLLEKFLNSNADMSKLPSKYHQPINCFVKESKPNFILTDGYVYTKGYFTKEAVDKY